MIAVMLVSSTLHALADSRIPTYGRTTVGTAAMPKATFKSVNNIPTAKMSYQGARMSQAMYSAHTTPLYTTSSETLRSIGTAGYSAPAFSGNSRQATMAMPEAPHTVTCSVMAIHRDVMNEQMAAAAAINEGEDMARPMMRKPSNPAVGQLTPIGDGLWALLMAALAYVGWKKARRFEEI